jgi:cell wall-associated NlpC family hydrolase
VVLLPFSGGSDTLAGHHTAHSRPRHCRRPLQCLRRTAKDTVKRAAPAEAASVDSALPAAPADAALAIEEGQGASSPTPMSGGGSGGEALSVGEAQLGKPFVLKTDGPNTFSCVGLMRYILRTIGTDSDAPWVPEEYLSRYPAVDRANLQPEDIVIYPGWATMYAGNGQLLNSNEMEGVVTHTPMDVAGEPLGIVRPY